MKRRHLLSALASGASAVAFGRPELARGIQLHVDLFVDLQKEKDMLAVFHSEFRRAASQQPGFKDAQMLNLRSALSGKAPEGANYRFVLSFNSEEERQRWVATSVHKRLWPTIEATLKSKEYTVLLYDVT
jgi:hypothetical protein